MTSFWQMGFEIAKPRVRDSGMNSYEWSNEFNKKRHLPVPVNLHGIGTQVYVCVRVCVYVCVRVYVCVWL